MNTRILLAVAATVAFASQAKAQQTASQTYTVTVPTSIQISAPADATATHDESDNDLAFSPAAWTVSGNASAGVGVSFATATAFVHTVDSSFKRDAQLDLAVGTTEGPASWSVSTASDVTDYANSNEIATVTASSDGVGLANFDLTVTFITDTFGTFAAGDYSTTVTGTVTAN